LRADARAGLAALALLLPLAAGCRQGMFDQAKYEPYEKSALFPEQSSARQIPEGTVARGRLMEDRVLATGVEEGGEFAALPVPVTRELLARGRERYDVFCAPCHDRVGGGDGMIVRRGFVRPPSYHTARLRDAPDGYLFDVMSRGFGQMPSYASQVPPEDRWAIVAYIRALQLSQDAGLAELPPAVRRVAVAALAAQPPFPAPPTSGETGPRGTSARRPAAPPAQELGAPADSPTDAGLGPPPAAAPAPDQEPERP
jgi:mono/diheme cytochrome c family protein